MERFLNIFHAGGPMMIPILFSAFVAALLFLERFLYLHKGQIRAVDFINGLKNSLKEGRLTEALTICEETPCPVSRVVKAALLTCESGRTVIADSARAAALLELPMLQRRIASIMLIAKIAPLMGMIGTILALLQIFSTIASAGSYFTVDAFSAQIFNALVSTAAGLLLCLVSWIMYALLQGRVRAIAHDIDWAANEIILFIEKGMPANEGLRLRDKDKNE